MIVSAHHLTGFWFESEANVRGARDQEMATEFLASALKSLGEFEREGGLPRGAINTGLDPAALSTDFAGHVWLKERLQWMKRTFGENFDDEPGQLLKDPGQRRNPFPAFHWTIKYDVGGGSLPLDGVQVLIGHDFAVVHEFSVLPPEGAGAAQASRGETRFAAPPQSSALFTAAFDQRTEFGAGKSWEHIVEASRIFNQKISGVAFGLESSLSADDWSDDEFAGGRCPRVKATLKCGVRASGRRYRGRILVEGPSGASVVGAADEARSQIIEHVKASAYLTYYCTLLVNDAKAQYECQVADRAFAELKHSLDIRSKDAEGLLRAWTALGQKSFTEESVGALGNAHLTDRKLLARFDQLIRTCRRNSEQFEQVALQLMESDNRWTADVRRRMGKDYADLQAARQDLRARLETTKSFLEELRHTQAADGAKSPARPAAVERALIDLRDRLRGQLRDCNDFCLAFAEFRLFEPSQEALDELFEHEIHIPVTSKRDFRSFIIVLHMVFDEAVPDTLRKWKRGQPLPDPLTKVAEVLHGDTFGQLTIIRNKFGAHDGFRGDGATAAKKLAQAYEKLIGVRTVARFNASAWLELQKAVLGMLSSVLEEVLQIFGDYQSGSDRQSGARPYAN